MFTHAEKNRNTAKAEAKLKKGVLKSPRNSRILKALSSVFS
jgi:hypothetical protein